MSIRLFIMRVPAMLAIFIRAGITHTLGLQTWFPEPSWPTPVSRAVTAHHRPT
jgi:hypothetical protein